jgi:hypothetical protein
VTILRKKITDNADTIPGVIGPPWCGAQIREEGKPYAWDLIEMSPTIH